LQVTVHGRVAVPGKVLDRREQPALTGASDEGGRQLSDQLRVLAVRTDVDHGVGRVVVDVGHRSEGPVQPESARLARGHLAAEAGRLLGPCGADRHRVGQRHHPAADAERQAALHVGRDEQRHVRQRLQPVEHARQRADLRFEHHHGTDLQVAHLAAQAPEVLRIGVLVQAEGADADHLRHPRLEGQARECLPYPV
jgi:hypothetical protein